MQITQFKDSRTGRWDELDMLLKEAGSRPERLPPDRLLRLGQLYRLTAADVAIARREFGADPLTLELEGRAGAARAAVYGKSRRRRAVVNFVVDGYWNLLYGRRRALALSAALLIGAATFGAIFGATDPEGAAASVPPDFLWVVEASSTDQGLDAGSLAGFSTAVFVNNILVTVSAFALGITFGIGTAWVLAYNGYILGMLGALAVGAGNGRLFVEAVAAHGILELSCIVVAGAAGLSLGRSILAPGTMTRSRSLRQEAPASIQLAAGTGLWLILAGFVEGFASRTGVGWAAVTAIGLALGGLFWGLFFWRSNLSDSSPAAGPHVGADTGTGKRLDGTLHHLSPETFDVGDESAASGEDV